MKHFLFEFHKIKILKQNGTTMATARIYQTSSKFSQVLSSRHPLLLAVQVSLCSLPLVWPGLIYDSIGSYAQGLWHSGPVDLVVCSCSVPCLSAFRSLCCSLALHLLLSGLFAFRSLCCSLDLPWFWIPGSLAVGWLVIVMEQYIVGDKLELLWGGDYIVGDRLGLLLGWGALLYYCSICNWAQNIICF